MSTWLILGPAIVAAGLWILGTQRWRRDTVNLVGRLDAARTPPTVSHFNAQDLAGLPQPVQRYFRSVLPDGQPIVTAVRVDHRGTFNIGETSDNWKRFTSRQWVTTMPPGFVWDARMPMLPGVAVLVHDAYVAGGGLLRAAPLGLFNMADLHGGGDFAAGELMRYLAEAVWYPTALLPGQGVSWQPVDDQAAIATLTDGANHVSLTVTFGGDGLIESVRSDARGRTVGGKIILTPWLGRWSNYQRRNGMLVPMTGEVAWILPEGPKTYWRGDTMALAYSFSS